MVVAYYLNRLGERTLLARSWEDRAARQGGRASRIARYPRDLRGSTQEIGELVQELTAPGFQLSPVRVLDILVWSQTESAGYYRAESASGQIDLT